MLSTAGITTSTGGASGHGGQRQRGQSDAEGTTVRPVRSPTTGGGNGAGGAIATTASSGLLNVTGAITTFGGTGNASSGGSRPGTSR